MGVGQRWLDTWLLSLEILNFNHFPTEYVNGLTKSLFFTQSCEYVNGLTKSLFFTQSCEYVNGLTKSLFFHSVLWICKWINQEPLFHSVLWICKWINQEPLFHSVLSCWETVLKLSPHRHTRKRDGRRTGKGGGDEHRQTHRRATTKYQKV